MKNKKIILILSIVILLVVVIQYSKKEALELSFKLDTSEKYIVTTNYKQLTTLKDGGSYTSRYYEIDFENNMAKFCEDKYNGKINTKTGYKYREKIIYTKTLSKQESSELQELLNRVINGSSNGKTKTESRGNYTITNKLHNDVLMYYQEDITRFDELVSN